MATLEELNKWADNLEHECPEKLHKRLEWFTHRLGIDHSRLLRLMGLSSRQINRIGRVTATDAGFDWEKIVKKHEAGAAWVEDAINQVLASFNYDVDALADRLRRPVSGDEYLLPRLGGQLVGLDKLSKTERDRVLLEQVAQGGGRSVAALLVYLSPSGNGSATKR